MKVYTVQGRKFTTTLKGASVNDEGCNCTCTLYDCKGRLFFHYIFINPVTQLDNNSDSQVSLEIKMNKKTNILRAGDAFTITLNLANGTVGELESHFDRISKGTDDDDNESDSDSLTGNESFHVSSGMSMYKKGTDLVVAVNVTAGECDGIGCGVGLKEEHTNTNSYEEIRRHGNIVENNDVSTF